MNDLSNSRRLRQQIEQAMPELTAETGAVVAHPRLRELYPEFLVTVHQMVRATVPLMRTALQRCRELEAVDPVAAAMVPYLTQHIKEEMHHDDWLLEDLELIGVSRAEVLRRMPPPAVASLIGAHYYWIHHHHPVAKLGQIAVMEGNPPSLEAIDHFVARTGYPRAAFRTLEKHAHLDANHRDDFDEALDRMPLGEEHHAILRTSALHTIRAAAACIRELLERADPTPRIPLRRPHLIARRVDEGRFRLEDALRGAVYQFGEQEHFLLTQCDGRSSAESVRNAFAERFGKPLAEAELAEFLQMAQEEELTTTDGQMWKAVEDTWWNKSPQAATEVREAAVERTDDAKLRKYRRFFWEYDRHSHPVLLDHNPDVAEDEKSRRKAFVWQVCGVLADRVLKRADWHQRGQVPGRGDLPLPAGDEAIAYLSAMQLDLIRRCLPGPAGGIDLAAYDEAFEMFANGELRVPEADMPGPSESNNSNNFSFAEFAFLAIEAGVDVAEWSRLLNPLVRMQRIFMTVYRPDAPGPYSYCDYRPSNLSPVKQVDADSKRGLREEYAGLTVEQLAREACRNAYLAFGGRWRADAR